MEILKTITTMLLLIVGLIILIAFWYVTIALVVIFVTYHAAKVYTVGKRIVNE